MRRTKMVFTIGPATESEEVLKQIIPLANIVRFNFSFKDHEWHKATLETVRKVQKDLGNVPLATIADLQGPKIRIGELEKEYKLVKGEEVAFTPDIKKHDPKNAIIYADYPKIVKDLKKGDQILLDNGYFELEVTRKTKDLVYAMINSGGMLKGRKTVNLPGIMVDLPILTEKDVKDLEFILTQDFDYVALSFVRSVEDVMVLKDILKQNKSDKKILVKIEDGYGVANFHKIIKKADGCIVARGDMGAEMDLEKLPSIQMELVDECKLAFKPSIIATHMLESMIDNPRPTRAEVTDVANAVWQLADSVWMSAETSVGNFPVQASNWMNKIVSETEKNSFVDFDDMIDEPAFDSKVATVAGAVQIAEMVKAKRIVVMTKRGISANILASMRPNMEIVAFCPNTRIQNQLTLTWGIEPISIDYTNDFSETFNRALPHIKKILKPGDKYVLVSNVMLNNEVELSVQVKTL